MLVIGLGNPILGDDGVGWQAAEALRARLAGSALEAQVEIDCLSVGGLGLMERLVDHEKVIIIDAITTGERPAGSVSSFPLEQLPESNTSHLSAAHDTSLQTALKVGRSMGAHLPPEIWIVAIEAEQVYDFSEQLSAPVAAAVPQAVESVIQILNGLLQNLENTV